MFRGSFKTCFRPGLDPDRWGNRSSYAALNVVPAGRSGDAGPRDWVPPFRASASPRFTLPADSGEMLTRPLTFSGKELVVNYATSAGGSLRAEIQDADSRPLPGSTLDEGRTLVGDSIEQGVSWSNGSDVSALAGRPVRLRFVLLEADLYALQFAG